MARNSALTYQPYYQDRLICAIRNLTDASCCDGRTVDETLRPLMKSAIVSRVTCVETCRHHTAPHRSAPRKRANQKSNARMIFVRQAQHPQKELFSPRGLA
eukprot:SAG11_NODE_138_length_15111_cov_11.388289_21_plen_101_part_00